MSFIIQSKSAPLLHYNEKSDLFFHVRKSIIDTIESKEFQVDKLIHLANKGKNNNQKIVFFQLIVEKLLNHNFIPEAEQVLQAMKEQEQSKSERKFSQTSPTNSKLKSLSDPQGVPIEKIGNIAEAHFPPPSKLEISLASSPSSQLYTSLHPTSLPKNQFVDLLFDPDYPENSLKLLYAMPWLFTTLEILNIFLNAEKYAPRNTIRRLFQVFMENGLVQPETLEEPSALEAIGKLHDILELIPQKELFNIKPVDLKSLSTLEKLGELVKLYALKPGSLEGIQEFAGALTRQHAMEFQKISPCEFYKAQFEKKELHSSYRNLQNFILLSDEIAHLVISTVLDTSFLLSYDPAFAQQETKSRARLIELYISLAKELFDIGNLNASFQVFIGLDTHAISRLTSVWACVSDDKTDLFDELKSHFKHTNMGGAARALEKKLCEEGRMCIPCINYYCGLFSHCNTFKLHDEKRELFYLHPAFEIGKFLYHLDSLRSRLDAGMIKAHYCLSNAGYSYKMDEETLFYLSYKIEPKRNSSFIKGKQAKNPL